MPVKSAPFSHFLFHYLDIAEIYRYEFLTENSENNGRKLTLESTTLGTSPSGLGTLPHVELQKHDAL